MQAGISPLLEIITFRTRKFAHLIKPFIDTYLIDLFNNQFKYEISIRSVNQGRVKRQD